MNLNETICSANSLITNKLQMFTSNRIGSCLRIVLPKGTV